MYVKIWTENIIYGHFLLQRKAVVLTCQHQWDCLLISIVTCTFAMLAAASHPSWCHHAASQNLPPFFTRVGRTSFNSRETRKKLLVFAWLIREHWLTSRHLGFGSRGARLLACKRKSKWALRADRWTAGGADSTGRILPRWGNNRWIDVFKTVDSSALLILQRGALEWVCKTLYRHGKVFWFFFRESCASAPPELEDFNTAAEQTTVNKANDWCVLLTVKKHYF